MSAPKPEEKSNPLLFGAVIIFIFVIVIGVIVSAIASARNKVPVTMTPGAGNALKPSVPMGANASMPGTGNIK
jgi:hypothetical protein